MGAVSAVTIASAVDITAVFQAGEYAAAAVPTRILAVSAALRVLFHLFPDMFNAAGKPVLTFRLGLGSLAVLALCLGVAMAAIGVDKGAVALASGWLGVYPILIPIAVWASTQGLRLDPHRYWRSLLRPALATVVASLGGAWIAGALSSGLPWWWARVGIAATLTLLLYWTMIVGLGGLTPASTGRAHST
jgi:hypothetical protein